MGCTIFVAVSTQLIHTFIFAYGKSRLKVLMTRLILKRTYSKCSIQNDLRRFRRRFSCLFTCTLKSAEYENSVLLVLWIGGVILLWHTLGLLYNYFVQAVLTFDLVYLIN